MIALLLSCQSEPVPAELTSLEAPRLLRRISLDLRGVLPSVDALDNVETNPLVIDTYIDAYLDDPLFEERMVSLFSEHFQTRLGEFEARYFDYHLDDEQEFPFERSVAEEPLRLIARVLAEDRPWSDIVTADHTMANELLADIWPLDYPAGAQGWQAATYTDGRPPAGILATNGLWWRYQTSPSNKNRRRAATITRLLLCEDILSRPISFSGSLSLEADVDEAIWENEACVTCHAAVDPLAAALFGFYWYTQYNHQEMTTYHPEREIIGEDVMGVEMAYFGTPIAGLVDLGAHIAADPRFSVCAAETMASLLWRRPVALADFTAIDDYQSVYLASDGRMKPLIREILASETYRAGALAADVVDETASRERTVRLLSPDQITTAVADLTGFTWEYGSFVQLANDEHGYRVLAGGIDGDTAVQIQQDPGLTWALVIKRLAQAAAAQADEEGRIEDSLESLHWRMFAERPTAAWLEEMAALQAAAEAAGGSPDRIALSVMLRDPEFVSY